MPCSRSGFEVLSRARGELPQNSRAGTTTLSANGQGGSLSGEAGKRTPLSSSSLTELFRQSRERLLTLSHRTEPLSTVPREVPIYISLFRNRESNLFPHVPPVFPLYTPRRMALVKDVPPVPLVPLQKHIRAYTRARFTETKEKFHPALRPPSESGSIKPALPRGG